MFRACRWRRSGLANAQAVRHHWVPAPPEADLRPSRRDAAPRGRRRDPRKFPHKILIFGGDAGVATGRGAGLPERKAESFAETGKTEAGIVDLPTWGHYRVPKAQKNRYLTKTTNQTSQTTTQNGVRPRRTSKWLVPIEGRECTHIALRVYRKRT